MKKSTRNILIAVVVLLVLLAIAYWWWFTKETVKFVISAVSPASGAAGNTALTLTGTTSSTSSPTTWGGKSIHIYSSSLGKLKSTVASASITNGAGTITTAPIAFASAFTYTAAPSDFARIYLKF